MKVTGERLVPSDVKTSVDYLALLRHQFVYEFVISQLQPSDRLLEVGFGEGYGTVMLSEACQDIRGVDVEPAAVEYAKENHVSPNCNFDLYDGTTLPYDDDSFDVLVSFQVIEHVVDDRNFVKELHRVLKPGGRLFMSTPNRATRLKPGQKPWNRYHIREYYQDELTALLADYFGEVKMLGVSGSELIHEIELNRIKQGPLLTIMLNLGLRRLLSERTDAIIARWFGRLRGKKYAEEDQENFEEKFSVDDFRIETARVDQALDLFGVAIK